MYLHYLHIYKASASGGNHQWWPPRMLGGSEGAAISAVWAVTKGAHVPCPPQPWYSEEDCAFKEEISYPGYSVYRSQKHHLPIVLSSVKQRQQYQSKGVVPLSYFLPMLPKASVEPSDEEESSVFSLPLKTDSMDPFGMASEIGLVKSPSFQK